MVTLYLLAYSEELRYSFDKTVLEEDVKNIKGLASNFILTVEIDEKLAEQLNESPQVSIPYPRTIPLYYYEKEREYLKSNPVKLEKDGMRTYIIFDKEKRCHWCPSGNNLNSIYKENPQNYLSDAIRVELHENSYIDLNVYFEFMCDNY